MDFGGKIDGESFQGGQGSDQPLVLGSKEFIPGFEDQLVGFKAGDEKAVTVTFPEDYNGAHLAGKEADLQHHRQGSRPSPASSGSTTKRQRGSALNR